MRAGDGFETAGAEITVAEVEELLDDPRIRYLSEMMNFPGMLHGDPECLAKVKAAHDREQAGRRPRPGLRGEQAAQYIAAGITTDHECFTKDEALDKLAAGCKISIREGSAARNFDALYTLLGEYPGQVMLCSDDKHPDELLVGHINLLVRRAVANGIDVYDALRAACITPMEHYGCPSANCASATGGFHRSRFAQRVQRAADVDLRRARRRERQNDHPARRAEDRQ